MEDFYWCKLLWYCGAVIHSYHGVNADVFQQDRVPARRTVDLQFEAPNFVVPDLWLSVSFESVLGKKLVLIRPSMHTLLLFLKQTGTVKQLLLYFIFI